VKREVTMWNVKNPFLLAKTAYNFIVNILHECNSSYFCGSVVEDSALLGRVNG